MIQGLRTPMSEVMRLRCKQFAERVEYYLVTYVDGCLLHHTFYCNIIESQSQGRFYIQIRFNL